jgi:peroxiredoxin
MYVRNVLFPILLVLAALPAAIAGEDDESTHTAVGDALPEIDLSTTDGARITNESLKGKVAVINFFATWCGPCKSELPHVEEIWKSNREHNEFALLVVGREHTAVELNAFREASEYTFPMAPDPKRETYSKFATQSIPRTYVVDRDGTIIYQSIGYHPEEMLELKTLIADELDEKPVAKSESAPAGSAQPRSAAGPIQNVEVSGSIRIRAQHRDH